MSAPHPFLEMELPEHAAALGDKLEQARVLWNAVQTAALERQLQMQTWFDPATMITHCRITKPNP